ncbi:MAG: PIN domain-containing protein [Fibrobacterota bacterium]
MSNRVYLDTDIIFDFIDERAPHFNDSLDLFNLIGEGRVVGHVSPLIFSNLYYIIRKQKNAVFARDVLVRLQSLLTIVTIDEKIVGLALASGFKDFEDAIQYYSAVENRIPCLVTRNKKDYQGAGITICTAKEYVQLGKFE